MICAVSQDRGNVIGGRIFWRFIIKEKSKLWCSKLPEFCDCVVDNVTSNTFSDIAHKLHVIFSSIITTYDPLTMARLLRTIFDRFSDGWSFGSNLTFDFLRNVLARARRRSVFSRGTVEKNRSSPRSLSRMLHTRAITYASRIFRYIFTESRNCPNPG